jgi:neutral ceramidase
MRLLPLRFVRSYRRALAWPGTRERSSVPRYLPLQQIRLGSLVVASLPQEATTVSGRRLRRTVLEAWRSDGVERAIVAPYSNAYAGYLTTPEEYDAQLYEGASTFYGRDSLPATCTEMARLAARMREGTARDSLGLVPPDVSLGCFPPMAE